MWAPVVNRWMHGLKTRAALLQQAATQSCGEGVHPVSGAPVHDTRSASVWHGRDAFDEAEATQWERAPGDGAVLLPCPMYRYHVLAGRFDAVTP
jgi:hypothetical protein